MLDILLWPFLQVYRLFSFIVSSIAKLFTGKNKKNESVGGLASGENKETKEAPKPQMFRYKYIAKLTNGKKKPGSVDALNKADARSYLVNLGYEIISLKEDKLSTSLGLTALSNRRKMRYKELTFFLTQLSTYITSGVPLTDSVAILTKQAKKPKDKTLYGKLVYELNKGVNFSDALSKQGDTFPKLLINMVRTAELTGDLTEILDDMAKYYKTSEENRKQIISALTYPSVIFVVAMSILTFIILYVVPQFTGIYAQLGTELPKITVIIIGVSDYARNNIFTIIIGVIVLINVLLISFKKIKAFRYVFQWIFMHVPVISNIIIYKEIIMFTKTFSTLIRHDVFITDSMDILKKITNNEIYKTLINDAINNLSDGNGVSPAFRGHWAFPSTAYEMLLTGEKTGKMGPMMDNVAGYYEISQKNLIVQLKSLIEPVMIIFLAFTVGIILLAVIIPMFDMYKNVL